MPMRVGTQTIRAGRRFLGIVGAVGMPLGPIRRPGWNYPLHKRYCGPRGWNSPRLKMERCIAGRHMWRASTRQQYVKDALAGTASPLSIWPRYQAAWNVYIKIKNWHCWWIYCFTYKGYLIHVFPLDVVFYPQVCFFLFFCSTICQFFF